MLNEVFEKSLSTENYAISDSYAKAINIIFRSNTAVCSISGGSDSDIILDIINRVDELKKVTYYWIDTGLEFSATKKHISFLEEKYGIEIQNLYQ